jgi:hypothetical protein
MNNDVDLKALVAVINNAIPKAPLTYRSERVIVFRGVVLGVLDGKATSDRINFTFDSVENFIEGLRNFGLMLSKKELIRIMSRYYIETI